MLIGGFMKMCCLVKTTSCWKSTHIGEISIQVKQESISIPNTKHSLTAVKYHKQEKKSSLENLQSISKEQEFSI